VRIRAVLAATAIALGREDADAHLKYLEQAGYLHPDFVREQLRIKNRHSNN
jgi:hypothetical protein